MDPLHHIFSVSDPACKPDPADQIREDAVSAAGYTTRSYRIGQQLEATLLGADDLADLLQRALRRAEDADVRAADLRRRYLDAAADACEVEARTLRVCALAMRSVLTRQGPPEPPRPGILGRVVRLWRAA